MVFIGDTEDEESPLVAVDNFETCRLVGVHLTKIGHRRIADVTGPKFFPSAMRKSLGFRRGYYDGGLTEADIAVFKGSYLPPSGVDAARWLMSMPGETRPTAAFFAGYDMAKGALAEFHDCGVRLPEDIAVAVFGVPGMDYVRPKVTRVVIDFAKAATIAADMLRKKSPESNSGGNGSSCHLTSSLGRRPDRKRREKWEDVRVRKKMDGNSEINTAINRRALLKAGAALGAAGLAGTSFLHSALAEGTSLRFRQPYAPGGDVPPSSTGS